MPLATTSSGTQVAWEGMTWTFQNPVTWGYFINGQPFVVAPAGTGVTLTGVQPGPQFVPYQQIRGKTGSGQPTVLMVNAYGYTLTGSTTASYGVMWNQPGNTHGMFINGQMLNPLPLFLNAIGNTSTIESANESTGSGLPYRSVDATTPRNAHSPDTRFINFSANAFNLTDPANLGAQGMSTSLNSWITNPRGLSAGDVIFSYDTPYYEDALFVSAGVQIPNQVTPSSGVVPSTRRIGVLSIVSTIPDANEFRPPAYWNFAYGSRPTGFTLGDVSGKTAAFLSLPTKGLDGRTLGAAFDPNNWFTNGSTMSLGLMSADSRTRNLFKYSLPPLSGLAVGVPSTSLTATSDSTLKPTHALFNIWGGLTYDEASSIHREFFAATNSISSAETWNFMYNNMPIFNAMSIFADWHSASDRRNSLIKTIQYAIDLYGMIKCNISMHRIAASPSTNAARPDPVCQRGIIILAGWLLNNQEMMNIDSVNESQKSNLFNWVTNSSRDFGLNFPTLTKMNSAFLFPEGNVRRLAGTYGDPSVANKKALAYTDPGTTSDLGLGWYVKYTTNPLDLSYGMTFASVGTTYNPVVNYVYNTSFGTGQTHALCYFTMYCGKKVTFQSTLPSAGATSGQIPFPKWGSTTTVTGTDHVNVGAIYRSKLIGCKLKVVSGLGSGNTEYTIIGTQEDVFPAPVGTQIAFGSAVVITNNTAAWSGIAKLGFILDKNWQNGVPDNTSRAIIYPFSSSDIGKCVSTLLSVDQYSARTNGSSENPYPDRMVARGSSITKSLLNTTGIAPEVNIFNQSLAYLAYMYGLLYQIGKRYPSSNILTNPITQDAMDYLLETMFGSEPYSPYITLAGDLVLPSNTTLLLSSINSAPSSVVFYPPKIGDQYYYGGLLRQLWEREVPRSRT